MSILANDEINFEVKEVFTNNRFILENYIFFFVILFITTSATSFYIVFRNRGVITLKEFVTIFTPYTLVYLVSTIFFLGILSLLSRFYFITEFEFLTIYFINILVSVLFFLGIYGYKNNKVISLNSFINIQSLTFKKYSLPFLIFFLTFTPALLIALGTKSLSVWLSLLFGLIAIFLSTRWITLMYFFKYSLDDIKGKFKRSKIDNKEEVKPKNQNSNKPKKNKSKKKKRR